MLIACLIGMSPPARSQGEESREAALHEFILVKVVPGKRAEFLEFLESQYLPLQRQDQHIRGMTYYLEDRGLEWDFIVVISYDDYAAAGRSQQRFQEILAKEFPEERHRIAFLSKFQGFVDRHEHMFYRDLPEFSH
jgi:hypothetical protein